MEQLLIFWIANVGLYGLWLWRFGAGPVGPLLVTAACVSLFYGYFLIFDRSGCGLWVFTVGFALLSGLLLNLLIWLIFVMKDKLVKSSF